jgi:phage shock protein C
MGIGATARFRRHKDKIMRFLDETNLFTRDDTFFGVCQGLGEDLGISGNWFRLAFALALFFSPVGAVAAYALAGAFVFAVRWFVPAPATAAGTPLDCARDERAGEPQEEALPLAA